MARVELQGIAHTYGGARPGEEDWAVRPLDLAFEDGACHALLGPSGCGKTTLLGIVSGLLRPTRGRVLIDGADVTGLAPRRRNVAQVFQFPVVYDTMTVFDNLAFPLRNRGVPAGRVRARVREVAALLELEAELPRRARRLTADAQQRVALGRGLVREDVAAILLDEPLTVVDPGSRWLLRRKLREVHARLRPTLIHVTHDQDEALTIADRVVVMDRGAVVQTGTPQELFEAPAHAFVGHFIGSPGMSFLPCAVEAGGAVVGAGAAAARVPLDAALAARGRRARGELLLGIRPEHVELVGAGTEGALAARVERVEDLGRHRLVALTLAAHPLRAKVAEERRLPAPGGRCWVRLPPARTRLFADGASLG